MTKGDIDTYTATFNRLLDEADFNRRDKGAIEMYKHSLNIGLKVSCIKRKPKPVTMDNWQEATREEHQEYLEVQHMLGRNPYSAEGNNLRNFQKGQNQQTRF
jgi:hypothetical protein